MRVLILTQPGDGHVNPLVPVADALMARQHEVLFATSPPYVPDVQRLGLPAIGIGPHYRWDAALDVWPDGVTHMGAASTLFWAQSINRDVTVPFVHALRSLATQWEPDVVVAEFAAASWGQALHDFDGIPFVGVAWANEPGRDRLTQQETGANEARRGLGLAPIDRIDPLAWITFTSPSWGALDGTPAPTTVRYRPADVEIRSTHTGEEPFIYATLGTVYNTTRSLLRAFITAIDAGGWSGLVTIGRTNDPTRFEHPANVAVEQFVPQADVLARADVIVCHGGLGSILGAINAAVPMVIVPLGADQVDNADKAARLGIARVVEPQDASVDVLRRTIGEVLGSSEQLATCRAMQLEATSMRPIDHMPDDLVALIG